MMLSHDMRVNLYQCKKALVPFAHCSSSGHQVRPKSNIASGLYTSWSIEGLAFEGVCACDVNAAGDLYLLRFGVALMR